MKSNIPISSDIHHVCPDPNSWETTHFYLTCRIYMCDTIHAYVCDMTHPLRRVVRHTTSLSFSGVENLRYCRHDYQCILLRKVRWNIGLLAAKEHCDLQQLPTDIAATITQTARRLSCGDVLVRGNMGEAEMCVCMCMCVCVCVIHMSVCIHHTY